MRLSHYHREIDIPWLELGSEILLHRTRPELMSENAQCCKINTASYLSAIKHWEQTTNETLYYVTQYGIKIVKWK